MISAPEISRAWTICWKLAYLPVPTIRRELNSRPAIISLSFSSVMCMYSFLSAAHEMDDLDFISLGQEVDVVVRLRDDVQVYLHRYPFPADLQAIQQVRH